MRYFPAKLRGFGRLINAPLKIISHHFSTILQPATLRVIHQKFTRL